MADNNFTGVIESLMKGMNSVLSTKTVVGEATQVGDTIILPLVDVTFGVGAGASAADKRNGGGGGFSAKMSPSAVLVIKNGATKLVNIKNQDTVTKVIDMIPDIIDKFTAPKEEMMEDNAAVDIAFPPEKQ
ncbi:MAG: GerW family sporulation protein [Lachnospiraceae bacterium]|nr:GerW family sporulation protein [Lachnospiraceae bacterium]